MKVLIVGAGSIGSRYKAILDYLGVKHETVDIGWNYNLALYFDKAIIASPTETHMDCAEACMSRGCDVLIEKPVSKFHTEICLLDEYQERSGVDARMVCNWKFLPGMRYPGDNFILYSNYRTGNDGLNWDCIQPIYLADTALISTHTPFFFCTVNGCRINLSDMEKSYVTMIEEWLEYPGELWNMKDALKANERIYDYEYLDRDTVQIWEQETTRKMHDGYRRGADDKARLRSLPGGQPEHSGTDSDK